MTADVAVSVSSHRAVVCVVADGYVIKAEIAVQGSRIGGAEKINTRPPIFPRASGSSHFSGWNS